MEKIVQVLNHLTDQCMYATSSLWDFSHIISSGICCSECADQHAYCYLDQASYAQGATWSPALTCQSGTRESLLGEIMDWVGNIEGNTSARIFCLTGVPGAGKTAIAHSVAKLCHDKGWLVTAFFFNKEDSVKAPMLFSTMTCDLASRFPSFRASLSQAIEQDPSLAAAGLTRQFQDLIVPFSESIPQNRPVLIILDGLDEGLSKELLKI